MGESPTGPTLELGGEGSEVSVDVNAAGEAIGIEIVDVAVPANVQLAQCYAAEHGLPFPNDIVSAARGIAAS